MISVTSFVNDYIKNVYAFFVLTLLLLCSIPYIFCWLAHYTHFFGHQYARLFYALMQRFNVTYVILPMKNPVNKTKDVFDLIDCYDPSIYWTLCLDTLRMNAYEEAVRQCAQHQEKAVWLDIGTGAHMPLTRLLIKYGVAEHVYAVEANRSAYQYARTLREHLPDNEKQKISLDGCYSKSIDWYAKDPRPNAIIHEIIGCISSDEGCIKVMHDTIENLRDDVFLCIPYQIGTLCVPVSRPKLSLFSAFSSFFLFSSMKIMKNIGIQVLFNPPKETLLCETPQFIENFILLDYARKPLDKCTTLKTKFIVEKSMVQWTGFYLAPFILTTKDSKNGVAEINGLKQITNWPVFYIQMYNYGEAINVKQGDEIHILFQSDLTTECPTYRLEAWLNDDSLMRSAFAWRGPAIF